MTTTPAYNAFFFPQEILMADEDLSRRFASSDAPFEDIFAAAEESGDKLLLALCASPVARRKEGLRSWREKQVAKLLEIRSKEFIQYGKSIEKSQWEKIKLGECALIDIDQDAARVFDETQREHSRLHVAAKNALKLALQKAVHDPEENSGPFQMPQSLYVSEDGEVLLFSKLKNAKQHGIKKGNFHVIVNIDTASARFRRGSGT